MTTKFTLELDTEIKDKIVLEALKEDFIMVKEAIKALEREAKDRELHEYELEDLKSDKKYLKAIKRVLRWHMYIGDYKDYMAQHGE